MRWFLLQSATTVYLSEGWMREREQRYRLVCSKVYQFCTGVSF